MWRCSQDIPTALIPRSPLIHNQLITYTWPLLNWYDFQGSLDNGRKTLLLILFLLFPSDPSKLYHETGKPPLVICLSGIVYQDQRHTQISRLHILVWWYCDWCICVMPVAIDRIMDPVNRSDHCKSMPHDIFSSTVIFGILMEGIVP